GALEPKAEPVRQEPPRVREADEACEDRPYGENDEGKGHRGRRFLRPRRSFRALCRLALAAVLAAEREEVEPEHVERGEDRGDRQTGEDHPADEARREGLHAGEPELG